MSLSNKKCGLAASVIDQDNQILVFKLWLMQLHRFHTLRKLYLRRLEPKPIKLLCYVIGIATNWLLVQPHTENYKASTAYSKLVLHPTRVFSSSTPSSREMASACIIPASGPLTGVSLQLKASFSQKLCPQIDQDMVESFGNHHWGHSQRLLADASSSTNEP